jgi:hypothetical protein
MSDGGVAPVGLHGLELELQLGGEAPCIGDILGLLIGLCQGLLIGLYVAAAAQVNELVSTSKVQT